MTDTDKLPDREPRPSGWSRNTVDPLWAIDTAEDAGMDVEAFLAEYNLALPREDLDP